MERKRQRDIAIGVVAVALILLAGLRIRAMLDSPAPPAAVAKPAAQASARQSAEAKPDVLSGVEIEALKRDRPAPESVNRNLFRFKPKPPPPPPPAPKPTPQQLAAQQQAVAAQGPPPPPPITMKFIGIVESPRVGRVAILSDPRGVYRGREGEIVEGRYRILKIGVESIELAYLDGRGRQTIRLTGQ